MIQGEAPLTVDFTDASSPTTAIATRLWDFGDGSTSTDQNPSHTYSSTGVYTVTLTIGNGISESIYRDFVLVQPIVPATSYWSLDETSGTRADLVSGHDLTPSGSPTTTTGRMGNGVLFAPATNDLLSVTHHADLQGGDVDLSCACWLSGTADAPSIDQYVVAGILNEWKVFISGFGFYTNHLRFAWWESDGTPISTWGPIFIYDNSWHFVCAWRDATAKTINLQIDGGEVFSEVSANGGQVLTNAFAIGGNDNSSKILAGTVDEVYVYRGLWTDQQKALLASLPPQPTQTNVERAAQVMLDISNDGGKTWIAQPWRSAGKQGEYLKRVRWNRLGAARRRVFQVSVTDPVAWKVLAAYLPGQGNGNG